MEKNKLRVLSIFGTRPEATKMIPLLLEMKKFPGIEPLFAATAQHRDMLDQTLAVFGVKPDYDLDIMAPGQSLYKIASCAIERLEPVMKDAAPDLVLVHGDTSTAFLGALAAFYSKVPVGHVEAGLRTFDKYSPYPEEINRRLVSPIADLHFCPTETSEKNLRAESITENIYVTGNTAIDLVHLVASEGYEFKDKVFAKTDFGKRVIYMTAHRRENQGKPMENICAAVNDLTERYSDIEVVFPVHKSPAVRKAVFSLLGDNPRVRLTDPVDVDDSVNMIRRCFFVLTDSGGLQEEAPSLGKPVVVMRTETERPEAVEAGTVVLAGVEREVILRHSARLLDDPAHYAGMARAVNPYGDGRASERIVSAILHHFGRGPAAERFQP